MKIEKNKKFSKPPTQKARKNKGQHIPENFDGNIDRKRRSEMPHSESEFESYRRNCLQFYIHTTDLFSRITSEKVIGKRLIFS